MQLLGSSNGRPRQIFHTLHNPIIGAAILQVHEPVIKTDEQAVSRFTTAGAGKSYATSIDVSRTFLHEEWIPWTEVEDFSSSDSHSRHYILDRLTGSIQFGDGVNGRIPPAGANNVRMREYHTGGGQRGNRPAAKVTQLHTTIPYVESVSNHVAAAGGQDQEDFDSLNRGAATLYGIEIAQSACTIMRTLQCRLPPRSPGRNACRRAMSRLIQTIRKISCLSQVGERVCNCSSQQWGSAERRE